MKACAVAHPNIAVVKYWGKRNITKNLPAVPSLSVTLDTFITRTEVTWGSNKDEFILNNNLQSAHTAARVFGFLDKLQSDRPPCRVESYNNFPTAAGLASSASAFSALALAATAAAQKPIDRVALSRLARQGSGSACRSIWGGWVEWQLGTAEDGMDSHAVPLASANHWPLKLIVAVVESRAKKTSSTKGMIHTQVTSPFYESWCQTAHIDVEAGKAAILQRDFRALGTVMEHSTMKMHASMLGAQPSLRYWKPQSLAIIDTVEKLRDEGIECYQTMDAGPNVKILCQPQDASEIAKRLQDHCQQVHILGIGGDAQLV